MEPTARARSTLGIDRRKDARDFARRLRWKSTTTTPGEERQS